MKLGYKEKIIEKRKALALKRIGIIIFILFVIWLTLEAIASLFFLDDHKSN